jgi:hypothetical protein
MGVSDRLTTSVRREEGGKIRVTSILWEDAKVIGKHEVLKVRNVDRRLRVARTERRPDQWDPRSSPSDHIQVLADLLINQCRLARMILSSAEPNPTHEAALVSAQRTVMVRQLDEELAAARLAFPNAETFQHEDRNER